MYLGNKQEKISMQNRLIVYTSVSLLIALLSYLYLDLVIAEFFQQRMGDDLWRFFRFITEAGEGVYWIIPPAIIYYAYKYLPLSRLPYSRWLEMHRHEHMRVTGFIAITAFLSGLIVNIFKLIFARYRPVEYFEYNNYGMTWFDHGYRMASFPSGHSATALGVAVAFSLLFPRYRYPIMVFGSLVLFSRVVVNAHYLSDVVAGGYVGVMTTVYLYIKYFRPSAVN